MPTLPLAALAAALLAVAATVAASGAAVARGRRLSSRPPRRRAPRPRHPVVLVHGLFGYDVLERDGGRREYFRGVPRRLADLGCTVHVARVAPVASVATRAAALARFVRALPDRRVNLVAHSMGGLNARYAIAKLGLGARVASLTTIGTPHRGTPVADLGVAVCRGLGLGRVLDRVGLERDAFRDLTTASAAAFNEAVRDVPGVAYGSIVGAVRRTQRAHPLLVASWALLLGAAGANDGLVPADSQRWGDVLAEIDADHFAQVGSSTTFDASALYEALVVELYGRGL